MTDYRMGGYNGSRFIKDVRKTQACRMLEDAYRHACSVEGVNPDLNDYYCEHVPWVEVIGVHEYEGFYLGWEAFYSKWVEAFGVHEYEEYIIVGGIAYEYDNGRWIASFDPDTLGQGLNSADPDYPVFFTDPEAYGYDPIYEIEIQTNSDKYGTGVYSANPYVIQCRHLGRCPFCGSADVYVEFDGDEIYEAHCNVCSASGPCVYSIDNAVDRWNETSKKVWR